MAAGRAASLGADVVLLERMRQVNFGFEKVERMDGNVGYLDLRSFSDTTYASETAVASLVSFSLARSKRSMKRSIGSRSIR